MKYASEPFDKWLEGFEADFKATLLEESAIWIVLTLLVITALKAVGMKVTICFALPLSLYFSPSLYQIGCVFLCNLYFGHFDCVHCCHLGCVGGTYHCSGTIVVSNGPISQRTHSVGGHVVGWCLFLYLQTYRVPGLSSTERECVPPSLLTSVLF